MEPRGHYVEPHAQDLSYLLAVTVPSLKAANSLPSGRKRVQKLDAAQAAVVTKKTP
jgi:hypothetical protein